MNPVEEDMNTAPFKDTENYGIYALQERKVGSLWDRICAKIQTPIPNIFDTVFSVG